MEKIISPVMDIFVISSCAVYKVPQIATLIKVRSFEGINLYSLILEMYSYTATTLYNFYNKYAMLSYLEYPVILVQQACLVFLAYWFSNPREKIMIHKLTLFYVIFFGMIVTQMINSKILSFVLPLCTPISWLSKMLCITDMLKLKEAKAVSLTTWILSTITNVLRFVTTYQDSGDQLLLVNFSSSAILSAGVFITAAYYQYQSSQRRKLR